MALVRINRFFEVYDLRPEIQDRPNMPALPQVRGEIGFHDVSFSYQEDQPVLRHISLPHSRASYHCSGRQEWIRQIHACQINTEILRPARGVCVY